MPIEIITGKRPGPVREVLYGTEGLGKSTLASKIPGALIIDIEDGTGQLDVARVLAPDWKTIESTTKELIEDPQGFKAVVYDSADWLEKALIEHLLKTSGKKSIEDFGFGKGYIALAEHFSRFLGVVDGFIAKGIHVVFTAHSKVVRVSPPDQTDGYDRYELKLNKHVAPILKEWSDLILFCNYSVQVVEGTDKKIKAQGGKERVMYTTHSAAWDAKNRFGLPDVLPMDHAKIAHIFTNAAPRSKPTPPPMATANTIAAINGYAHQPAAIAIIENELTAQGAMEVAELTEEVAGRLLADIEEHMKANPPEKAPDYSVWLDANTDAVTAYLVGKAKWLQAGQSWRDLTAEQLTTITKNMTAFAKKCGVSAP